MRKPFFIYAETKTQISCAVAAQLISPFVFAIRIVQSLYYQNPKFQASSHIRHVIIIIIIMSLFLKDYILSTNMNLSNIWSSVK